MSINNLHPVAVQITNITSVTSTAAALFGWLPPLLAALASGLTCIWMLFQIIESATYQRCLEWLKDKIRI